MTTLCGGFGTVWGGSGTNPTVDPAFGKSVEGGFCVPGPGIFLSWDETGQLAAMIEQLERIRVRKERLVVELQRARAEVADCRAETDEWIADAAFTKARQLPWLQRNFGWCVGPSVSYDLVGQEFVVGVSLLFGKKGLRLD